jgi:non-homologous end-joining factor 1
VKGVFGGGKEAGYRLLLWDAGAMWAESMDRGEVMDRMAALNCNLEAPSSLVLSHLSSILTSPPTTFSEATPTVGGRTLLVSGSMSGLPFEWQFQFTRAPESLVEGELVGPLLAVLAELCRQRQALTGLLRRKDEEIQDYRASGATLSRRELLPALLGLKSPLPLQVTWRLAPSRRSRSVRA